MRWPALARTQTFAGLWLGLAVASAPARAQSAPSIDARTWRPSTDADASLVLEPTTTPGPWRWNVGAWAQYAQDPILFRAASGATLRPVEHSVGLDVTAGLGLGDRVTVGVDVPLFLWQNGDSAALPATGLGDVAVLGKVTALSNDHQGVHSGFGLAALGGASIPTGDRASFLSDGAVGASFHALAEYSVGIGAARAEIGYSVRGSRTVVPDESAGATTFGNAIPWAIGVVVQPKVFAAILDGGDRQLWELAAHGSLPGGPVAPFGWGRSGASMLSPALLAFDDRIAIGRDRETYLLAGGEIGLDAAIGVPTFRAVVAVAWAPRSHDRDADGVPDDKDECPDLPEDRDGIQDADGCPEDDADGDEILDRDDACPLVAGLASKDPKQNGCPGETLTAPSKVDPGEKFP